MSRLLAAVLLLAGSGSRPMPAPSVEPPRSVDADVAALADTLVGALFERYPEWETYFGRPGARHDRLPDNSLAALARWQRREDAWLASIRAIDPATLAGRPAWVTYAMMREGVEQSVATRVCRSELWGVSQVSGWQTSFAYIADAQPVGTPELRRDALARWSTLPAYIDVEIANLRAGVRAGYTAPRENVRLVLAQIDAILALPTDSSPFFAPAARDSTPEFRRDMGALVRDRITPAIRRYRDFLASWYLPHARRAAALRALPAGARCYRASLRSYSTLDRDPATVHALGLREMERIDREMRAIAERAFGTSDVRRLLARLTTDSQFTFRTRDEMLAAAREAARRADSLAPAWFARLPRASLAVEPYPAFREAASVAEYNAPAEDGSRPGVMLISTYEPRRKSRANLQAIAFHEGIPGHHLATALALEGAGGAHPITRYLNNSGFIEGWALYAERLADEMGLYSTDLDRLGMLSEQAWRTARLVVDPGVHVFGWSRRRAIDYFVAHTAGSREEATAEVDKIFVMPGQAPAYMLGRLELDAMRRAARERLGARFDLRAFHQAILTDGSLPLPALRAKVERWAADPAR